MEEPPSKTKNMLSGESFLPPTCNLLMSNACGNEYSTPVVADDCPAT